MKETYESPDFEIIELEGEIATASTLKVGTTTPISSAVTPIFPSPAKDVATGIPNKTKLLRNMP